MATVFDGGSWKTCCDGVAECLPFIIPGRSVVKKTTGLCVVRKESFRVILWGRGIGVTSLEKVIRFPGLHLPRVGRPQVKILVYGGAELSVPSIPHPTRISL